MKLPFEVPGQSPAVTLRYGSADDLSAVEPLWRGLYEHHRQRGMVLHVPSDGFEKWVASLLPGLGRFTCLIVAELEGRLAGFIAGRLRPVPPWYGGGTAGWATDMLVNDSLRGRGIGTSLLDAMVVWFRAQGIERVEAQVITGNQSALGQYLKMGWTAETVQIVWLGGDPPERGSPSETAPGDSPA